MHFFEKYATVYFFSFFLLLVLYSFILSATQQKTTQWNYLFNIANALFYLSVGLTAFYGTKLHTFQSSVGRELFAIGIAMLSFALGLTSWAYYNLVLKISIPYPSFADIFFVLYIPFLGYGIVNLLREFGILFSRKIVLISLLIFIGTSLFVYSFGNPPDLARNIPLIAKTFNLFYLFTDSSLLTLSIMVILVTRGRIHKSFLFFILALFIMALGDFVFSYRSDTGTYWNGDIADILYAVTALCFSLGVTQTIFVELRIKKSEHTSLRVS